MITMGLVKILPTLIVIVCFIGCASRGKDAAPPQGTWSRMVEGICECNRDVVWNAINKAFSGYSLKQRDNASGVLITDWKATITPHDMLGPPGALVIKETTDESLSALRIPPRTLVINFEVKRRFLIALTEGFDGKTKVTLTRQMYINYFEGPKGSMKPEVYETLRDDFDTEEELNTLLKNILDIVSRKEK
jgi:hypothetical protein